MTLIALMTFAACGDNLGSSRDAGDLDAPQSTDDAPDADNTVQGPMVTSTTPSDGSLDSALDTKILADFDTSMAPLSVTSFTLARGATPVMGMVTTSADGTTARFSPSAGLVAGSVYTATITTAAISTTGLPLATNYAWTFTTGTTNDVTPPEVTATNPDPNDIAVPVNQTIAATFSERIDPSSLTATTFTLAHGGTPTAGALIYGTGTTVRLDPTADLLANTLYTATLTTGITDLQGNALASNYVWTFTTGTIVAHGPAPVGLGTAGNFVILSKAAISTVPNSVITGDIGVSPAAATYMTGFSLVMDPSNQFSRSTQVVGKAYAANYAVPTPARLTTAVGNMETAYTDAASRPGPNFLELGTGNIGGKTLVPGLYKWTTTVTIPTDVTISGGPNDTWIFQTSKDLTMSAAKHVILAGGARAKNVFWEVTGKVTIGAGAHFEGIVLCKTQVLLETSATMVGRILAQTMVALQKATVTQPL